MDGTALNWEDTFIREDGRSLVHWAMIWELQVQFIHQEGDVDHLILILWSYAAIPNLDIAIVPDREQDVDVWGVVDDPLHGRGELLEVLLADLGRPAWEVIYDPGVPTSIYPRTLVASVNELRA